MSRSTPAAIRLHAIQVRRAIAFGGEDDGRAVGGERRVIVRVEGISERALAGPVGGGDEEAELSGLGEHPGDGHPLRIGGREPKAGDGDERDESHPATIALPPVVGRAKATVDYRLLVADLGVTFSSLPLAPSVST